MNNENTSAAKPEKQSLSKIALLNKDPLAQWLVYFYSIALVLSFIGGRLLVEAVIADKSGICAVITMIFIAATVKNLLDILYIRREIDASNKHITELLELKKVDAFVAKNYKGMLAKHIYNLYQMSLCDDAVNQDSLIILLQNKLTARLSMTGISWRTLGNSWSYWHYYWPYQFGVRARGSDECGWIR